MCQISSKSESGLANLAKKLVDLTRNDPQLHLRKLLLSHTMFVSIIAVVSHKFNSIHFICQSVVCNCKYVTLQYMNITDSRETPTKVQ